VKQFCPILAKDEIKYTDVTGYKTTAEKGSVCHTGKNSPLIYTYGENSFKLPLYI